MKETDLYPPLKRFLEGQGYTVKSEIGAADVVALRGDEPPLIVEMKLRFALTLLHQAIARQAVTDDVYIAVAHQVGKRFAAAVKANTKLARRLGLGLITVRTQDGLVVVHCDPGPYAPRKSKPKTRALLREFAKRAGDPNAGGQTRAGLVTAYRQDALRVAGYLAVQGPSRGAVVAKETGVAAATRLMRDNHYGWFLRVSTGIYDLTEPGRAAARGPGG